MTTATHDTTAPARLSPTQATALRVIDEYAPMRVEAADVAWHADVGNECASQALSELFKRGILDRDRVPEGSAFAYRRKP